MKKTVAIFAVMLMLASSLTSCKTQEEKALARLESLVERAENDAQTWDNAEWAEMFEELDAIRQDLAECEFSKEQLHDLGTIEGRLTQVVMTEGLHALGGRIGSYLDGAGSFLKGYMDGVADENALHDLGGKIEGAFNRLFGGSSEE